jgi:hypothetical protein
MNYLSLLSNYLKSLSSSVDPTIHKTRMNTYLAPSSSFIEIGLAKLELRFKDFYLNIFLLCLFVYNNFSNATTCPLWTSWPPLPIDTMK